MTRDDIIRMAQEAGIDAAMSPDLNPRSMRSLLQFATLVAAAEREACALAIKDLRDDHCEGTGGECSTEGPGCDFVTAWNDAIEAIRARGDA